MYRCMYEGLNCLMIAEDWNMQIIKSRQIILFKIGILVRVVHLGLIIIIAPESPLSLCVGGPQPVSRVDSCLAK